MDFRPMERAPGASQEPVTAAEVEAMCGRLLGANEVLSAVELGWGSYNTTFRVELAGRPPVVLRIAPRPEVQLRSERDWLRSEYAAAPWLVGLGALVPQVLGADFTHQVIGRDFMAQTFLYGIPAPDKLPSYDRALWPGFFAQLGEITRRIHTVPGESWGPLAAPVDQLWSEAVLRSLAGSVTDLDRWSLPSHDVVKLSAVIEANRDRLDRTDDLHGPRLLHGDLWTANILLDPVADKPTVVGVVDSERAWWGDPLADWAIYRADARAVTDERDAFWSGYGGRPEGPQAQWRRHVYQGRHLVAERVEAARGGQTDRVAATIGELAGTLSKLG